MNDRTRRLSLIGSAVALVLLALDTGALATGAPPKIRVDRESRCFIDAAGRPFVPFGVSYYRPGTGWAPQVWKQFDAEATRRDFVRLRQLGGNVVRVFLSFGSFLGEPGRLDPDGLKKFDRFLELADEAGLYVHPTGPDLWEGVPAWASALDPTEERMLEALEDFWRQLAGRYRGRSTIWVYDLRNEPAVSWDGPSMKTRWDAWRAGHHRPPAPIPDAHGHGPSSILADFQRFREQLARTWVERQARAIHTADPEALVTVGLVQWSFPAQRMEPGQYSGFRPELVAPFLDFMELHFYPLATGAYGYDEANDETANLANAESMAHEAARPGLPVVIAEFGWYGGGSLEPGGKPATEEQQARWCRRLVEVTAPLACGWLNWGLHDHPQAGDVSRHSGLLTEAGRDKAWARAFRELAAHFRSSPPVFSPPADRPDLSWDECTASGEAMERFRLRYLKAFSAARQPTHADPAQSP
jgi:hypothetical protein